MKLMKKIILTTAALAISISNATIFTTESNSAAVNWDKLLEDKSGWIPYDFGSAMYFHNNYGNTKVEGNLICIVYHVPDFYKMSADISTFMREGGTAAENEYECNTFTFDFNLTNTSSRRSNVKTSKISGSSSVGYHYEALMIMNNCAEGFDIDISLENTNTRKSSDSVRYTFVNDEGQLKETDIYDWLPDSVPEFNEYIDKNGNISLRDGLLVYCKNINTSTGESLNVEQTGSGKLGLVVDTYISKDNIIQAVGGANSMMKVYKGETEGNVDITFNSGREWATDETDLYSETASVYVDGALNITENIKDIPDWIPQDYESAVKFSNEHGSSFVNDGIICFVRNEKLDRLDEYPVGFEGSISKNIACYELINKVYDDPEDKYYAYNVRAYDIPNSSDLTVNFKYGNRDFDIRTVGSYSFQKDSTGYITQTDKYSWLPDCHDEFNAYFEKHGNFSIQDDYVMYCTNIPSDDIVYLSSDQKGTGTLIEDHEEVSIKHEVASINTEAPDSSVQNHIIKLFKPVKPGTVKLIISKKKNPEQKISVEEACAYFTVTEDMHIIPAEEKDMKTTVKGDCNGDGILGISDLVSMNRWLLGKDSLPEYGIADINGDDNFDIFDFVELRKLIIKTIKDEPRPVMLFIDENYAWLAYQEVTVIDQYGSAYKFKYSNETASWSDAKDDLIVIDSDNWYEQVLGIMASGNDSTVQIPDSAMAEINKFTQKAESYSKSELSGIGYMCDAGSSSVYIIGSDTNGNPVNAKIATCGDFYGWIDTSSVKDFIKLLSSYNIYGSDIIDLLEYNRYSDYYSFLI